MNKEKRLKLNEGLQLLSKVISIVSDIREEEENSFNNIPDNLENTEMYSRLEESVENLNSAVDLLEEAYELIEDTTKC